MQDRIMHIPKQTKYHIEKKAIDLYFLWKTMQIPTELQWQTNTTGIIIYYDKNETDFKSAYLLQHVKVTICNMSY